MRIAIFASFLLAPLAALAAPAQGASGTLRTPRTRSIEIRQVVTPAPCVALNPPPTEDQMKARFDAFANAFLVTKNLTEAFSYISKSYKQHRPGVQDGPDFVLDVLGPIWPTITITEPRWTSNAEFGWLNYKTSVFGEIVDKYKFEAGCITEHVSDDALTPGVMSPKWSCLSGKQLTTAGCNIQWDEGEVYPTP
ncbi:hypothetical protein QBC34DRAFT_465050 [Podospora aff. communis PSN243]|uniref:Uncharacterized protein n=1 Tax=Podospora aff. communis PSN243 TaxID=3040156 RepID=A0AAV9H249_9PEZI|nr:hypothetical protein QBC34DRAFT_465050 [Podospora aff. communis PSN243]